MGIEGEEEEQRSRLLIHADDDSEDPAAASIPKNIPKDNFHLAYIVYFILGIGYLLPWNAFITAVDYFSYLYPAASVDRVFSVAYMLCGLCGLLVIIVGYGAHLSSSKALRINSGLSLFVLSLLVVPIMDAVYVKGRTGLYAAYDVTVFAIAVAGIADALVQGGVIGSAGELPERYMQASVAGTGCSGVLVSVMRVVTKALYTQDTRGLRKSAILYFIVSIAVMALCIFCYNIADRFPVIQYYKNLKLQALKEERSRNDSPSGSAWRSTLWEVVGRTKWSGFGIFLIYLVTLSIFPGYVTEDVHSEVLKDWYPIILISGYNLFDFIGKALPGVYLLANANVAVAACVARLLFYPLFLGCLHGPEFFRTEIPVTVLTCLLGLTNGYFTSVLMILAPKSVPIQRSETAGIVMVLFLVVGLAAGSIVAWFWVI